MPRQARHAIARESLTRPHEKVTIINTFIPIRWGMRIMKSLSAVVDLEHLLFDNANLSLLLCLDLLL